jgi:putative ABC transport system permease protein
MSILWRKLQYLRPSYRRAQEREMQEELESLARMADPPELGNITRAAEEARAIWGWVPLEQLYRDVQYGLRTMRQSPGFAAAAVLSLALGIGANTAIFSLLDALMLRWLPVRNPQELIQLSVQTPEGPESKDPFDSFSYPIVQWLSKQRDIFAGVAGFSGWNFDVGPDGGRNRVSGAMVTGDYYQTLGLNPAAGRLLMRDDDQPGTPLVAVIGYGYWERNGRGPLPHVIRINGVPVTIIGVSPPGFVGANVGSIAEITMPIAGLPRINPEAAALLEKGNFWLRVLARPKPGVSIPQAKARLAALWPGVWESLIRPGWPSTRRKAFAQATFQARPGGAGWTYLRKMYRKPLVVLMAAVALVLLIACANVANLLLARATARQREIAVRLAIGASRGRIVRQLLTESTLLSLSGAAFGIALAWVSSRFLISTISGGPDQIEFDLTPNWHVLAFTTAVSIATGVLFGLAPALQMTKAGSSALKEGERMSHSSSQLLSWLVSVQVALSLLLLIGAGLFVRTMQNLKSVDLGFNRQGVLLVNLEGRRTALPPGLIKEIEQVRGVISATVSTHTPLNGSTWSEPAVPRGQVLPEMDNAHFVGAGPHFFETMQTRLLAGRQFDEHDIRGSGTVALINEAYAAQQFRNQNAVEQHLSAVVRGQREDLEIVGVVANSKLAGFRKPAPPTVYVPYAQLSGNFPTTIAIRVNGPPGQVPEEIRRVLQPRLPDVPIEVRALSAQVEYAMVEERMMATLASAFGVLALLLACTGLYGLISYGVARRTREMGIRIALGAQRRGLIVMVLKGAGRLLAIGIGAGLPAAWAASRWVESMLFGLKPTDPGIVAGSVLLLSAAAMLATYLPARRASHIDPITALRHE